MTSKRLGEVAFNAAYDYREKADRLLNWSYQDEEEKELWDRAAQGVKAYLEEKCGISLIYDEEKLGDLVTITPNLTVPPIEPGSKAEHMAMNGLVPVVQITEDRMREMYNPGCWRVTNLDKPSSMLIDNTGGTEYGTYTKQDILIKDAIASEKFTWNHDKKAWVTSSGSSDIYPVAEVKLVCNGLVVNSFQVLPGESYIFKDGVFTKAEEGFTPETLKKWHEYNDALDALNTPEMKQVWARIDAQREFDKIQQQQGMSADDEIKLLKAQLEAVTLDRDRLQAELIEAQDELAIERMAK